MCEIACPPLHRTDRRRRPTAIERRPRIFDIDLSRCMFCGLCEEACPEEAIVMSPDVEIACESREGLIWHKSQLLKPAHLLKPRLEYIRREYNRYESARGASTDEIGSCNARLGTPESKGRPAHPPSP
jgi:NADH-quinone oxidoreductase subunit I